MCHLCSGQLPSTCPSEQDHPTSLEEKKQHQNNKKCRLEWKKQGQKYLSNIQAPVQDIYKRICFCSCKCLVQSSVCVYIPWSKSNVRKDKCLFGCNVISRWKLPEDDLIPFCSQTCCSGKKISRNCDELMIMLTSAN